MIKNEEYFPVYDRHLADCNQPRIAWIRTEKDFFRMYGGVRRFMTHKAMLDARRLWIKKGRCQRIVLHVMDEFTLKID